MGSLLKKDKVKGSLKKKNMKENRVGNLRRTLCWETFGIEKMCDAFRKIIKGKIVLKGMLCI